MSELKRLAASHALEKVEDGMTIGLGSGSTVNEFIHLLGKQVAQGFKVRAVPSSRKTAELAREAGVPLMELTGGKLLDMTVDGADEADDRLDLMKGGGGSLVREKIVAAASDKLVIIIDGSKKVKQLGDFPLPVEVVPFGWQATAARIAAMGCEPVLRKENEDTFVSDNGNYILDCRFGAIHDADFLHKSIKQTAGVIETGLFINMADCVIIATETGIKTLTKAGGEHWKKM